MSTTVYDLPRGRRPFISYVVICTAGIALVLTLWISDLVDSLRRGVVSMPVDVSRTADVPQPPDGATVTTGSMTLQVHTSDITAGAATMIRVADGTQAFLVCVLIALVAAVAWQISRGRLFDPATARIVDAIGLAGVATGFVPLWLRSLGGNWLVASLGWHGVSAPDPAAEPAYVPIYVGLLLTICFRFAIAAAQRMVRDQNGLV